MDYPYYRFQRDNDSSYYESRFWNCQGKQIAIVAQVSDRDWAAYIGTDAPDSYTEQATCEFAANYGCKLSKENVQLLNRSYGTFT